MNEFLYRPMTSMDIGGTNDCITSIDFSMSSYGILNMKMNYTTTKNLELPMVLLNKDIKDLEIRYLSSGYSDRLIFSDLVRDDGVRVTFVAQIDGGKIITHRYFDNVLNYEKLTTISLPKYTDLLFYIKEEYIEEYDDYKHSVRVKNGTLSTLNNEIFDIEIDNWVGTNNYVFGFGAYVYSPTTSNKTFYNMQIAYDTTDLGGGGQIIDPTLSTKSVSKYIDGQEYRLLTEDMVVDPTKVDTSKALVIDEDAPRVLTEECLNVASTTNTKDHKIHPKVNPIIEIDTTCEGCEKLGRD